MNVSPAPTVLLGVLVGSALCLPAQFGQGRGGPIRGHHALRYANGVECVRYWGRVRNLLYHGYSASAIRDGTSKTLARGPRHGYGSL